VDLFQHSPKLTFDPDFMFWYIIRVWFMIHISTNQMLNV